MVAKKVYGRRSLRQRDRATPALADVQERLAGAEYEEDLKGIIVSARIPSFV